jgi:hypothetical protein
MIESVSSDLPVQLQNRSTRLQVEVFLKFFIGFNSHDLLLPAFYFNLILSPENVEK